MGLLPAALVVLQVRAKVADFDAFYTQVRPDIYLQRVDPMYACTRLRLQEYVKYA